MLLSSLLLGSIVIGLSKDATQSSNINKTQITWAFFSAALFDLYPIHISAVNWFAAQHTILVTLFYLLSFWCYISWRKSSTKVSIISSICCFGLALLTEEAATTLPFILLAYEILLANRISISINWRTALKKTLLITTPYWLVLIAYFFLRKFVLGTFIVKSSTLYHQRFIDILQTWLHGLQQLLIPLDISILAKDSPVAIAWGIIIISALLLSLYTFIMPNKLSGNRRLGLFLITWFVCSLAPASNIFGTNFPHFHLINARVTYLATVPLCMLATCGLSNFSSDFKYSTLIRTIGGAFIALSALILYCNNQAYADIGHRSNKVIKELQKYYQSIPGDPLVRILGLPPPTNALGIISMPKVPFLERNLSNCSILEVDDWYIPFAFLKESINTGEGKIYFLYWDDKEQKLKPTIPYCSIPISMIFPITNYKKTWQGKELKAIIHNETTSPGKVEWENESIHLVSDSRSSLEINLAEFPCWPIDFVSFEIAIGSQPDNKSTLDYELHFLNNIVPDYSLNEYCSPNTFSRVKIIPNGKEQKLIFPLRNFPDWALGDKCRGLKLVLPPHSDIKLLSMSLPEANTIIPIVSGSSLIKLNQSSNNHLIHYDASHITGCIQVALEVIGPYKLPDQNKDFETPYSNQPDPNVAFSIPASSPSGMLKILHASFPGKGTYKARLRALNKNGEQVGLCGDHFFINIE